MAPSALLSTLAVTLEQELADYMHRRDDILEVVTRLRTNRLVEQCRRHLEGLTLKSTYNSDRVRVLEKLVADLRSELEPLARNVIVKRTILEFAEQELADYRESDEVLRRDRAVRQAINMYAEPARFVDLLFRDHQIDRSDFAPLTPDDIANIAAIIEARSSPLRTGNARAATIAKARKL